MCAICTRLQICTRGTNLQPRYILAMRCFKNLHRVKICSYFRGGANFTQNEHHIYHFDNSSTRYLNLYGYRRSPLPDPTFWIPNTRRVSLAVSMPALYTNSPNLEPDVRWSWLFLSFADLRKSSCQFVAKIMGTRD